MDSYEAFARYGGKETEPKVVRMVSPGGISIDHWYYRSNERIACTNIPERGVVMGDYDGPADGIDPKLAGYFERFEVDEGKTFIGSQMIAAGCKSLMEYADKMAPELKMHIMLAEDMSRKLKGLM